MAEPHLFNRPGCAVLKPVKGLSRFVFRGSMEAETAAGAAFGLAFPAQLNRAATLGERAALGARAALRLGPDELLLITPEAEGDTVFAAIEMACAVPHSLVDVSDRNAGLVLAGTKAADMLNSGCPLDLGLAAFPVGMATRTLFHKAEITLWRVMDDAWRIEIWRSFVPYFKGMIEEAARDHD